MTKLLIEQYDHILFLKQLHPEAITPRFANSGDVGMDLPSVEDLIIKAGERALIGTGWAMELWNPFYCLQVCSRSGLAANYGVFVLNAPGIIDFNYRGEIKVILQNSGAQDFEVRKGMRIAQLLITPVLKPTPTQILIKENLSEPDSRGEGGFGSTGL